MKVQSSINICFQFKIYRLFYSIVIHHNSGDHTARYKTSLTGPTEKGYYCSFRIWYSTGHSISIVDPTNGVEIEYYNTDYKSACNQEDSIEKTLVKEIENIFLVISLKDGQIHSCKIACKTVQNMSETD